MKIFRNGNEIELTAEEVRLAYEEYHTNCLVEDVLSEAKQMNIDIPENEVKNIANNVDNALSKNDGYMESYWYTIENALHEFNKR